MGPEVVLISGLALAVVIRQVAKARRRAFVLARLYAVRDGR